MTKDEFLRRLRRGLAPMPSDQIDEIVADYEDHFVAAREEGRPDGEVAEALGNPSRLARELKLEAGIKRWEEARSPSSAWSAVIAFLGLGAIDILVLAPIVLPALGVIFGLYVAVVAMFIAGGGVLIAGPFTGFPGGPVTAVFGGFGLMALSIALGAVLTIVTIWVINALMWFGRLHYKVIEPAIERTA